MARTRCGRPGRHHSRQLCSVVFEEWAVARRDLNSLDQLRGVGVLDQSPEEEARRRIVAAFLDERDICTAYVEAIARDESRCREAPQRET